MIGNRYQKFKEATDLIDLKGCISVKNQQEFNEVLIKLKNKDSLRISSGKINKKYIQDNLGATQLIMNFIKDKI